MLESAGLSKSAELFKVRAPVEESIENLDASAPPFNDQVTVSLEENVCTAVVFSFIDLANVVLPDSPDSMILETETVTV